MAFWKNKKVFITGHTGFKGRWLSLWLTHLGANIQGFSLEQGDIGNPEPIKKVILDFKPDIIFHLAAQSLVHAAYKNPVDTYMTNVMGTINVLEAVRECSRIKAVINITSDKCYENNEWLWAYRENEPLGGHDPYSNSKACAELVTASYRKSFFDTHKMALASVRAGNIIGGGDWSENRLVPDLMRAFSENKHPVIRHPDSIRPWQHVLDALRGYLLLAEKCFNDPQKFSEAWNFGPYEQDIRPVRYIADSIVKLWGKPVSWVYENQNLPHEAHLLKLDSTKARVLLNWSPKLSLDESLKYTVDWYNAYFHQENMQDFSLMQIQQYEEKTL